MPARISDRTILDAVIATVIEYGYAGATTRQIAARAGINEVTLFRRFGDKQRLMLAAVHADIAAFAAAGTEPTSDLHADLRGIVVYYARVMDEHGPLLLVLMSEAARSDEIRALLREPLAVQARLRALLEHHQRTGALMAEPPAEALQALIGPLLVRTVTRLLEPSLERPPVDPDRLVARFLAGHAQAA